jgi:predicted  nucleic acid-binding Zn-ribbon protein
LEQPVQETILNLITLQDLDNKIRIWRQTAAEGPAKLEQARERLSTLEAERDALVAKQAENAKARRELEAETADLTQRKATNQTRQLKARNNNEYRAVLKEAETIASTLTAKEDELLVLMDEGEKLQSLLPGLAADCANETLAFADQESTIRAIIKEGQLSEAEALEKRSALLPSIPPAILGRYNTIAGNRDGQAMAPVVQGMCRICRLSIPPQLFNELQKNDKLLACPNCARILYWMHHPAFKDFCTEPEPQVQGIPGDKAEKQPKGGNGKRRRSTKGKEAPESAPAPDGEKVAQI